MTITISTREFEFSHGKAPRGFGGWAFEFEQTDGSMGEPVFYPASTYGEARKRAISHARRMGAEYVNVCP